MKSDNSLLITVFCLILFGILAIYGLILYRVTEIENFLKIHEGVNVTDEFKFMIDFADRNIEFFVWYSTLLFAAVAIASAFILRLEFNRSVETVRSEFISFKDEARDNYNGHEKELFKLRKKVNLNLATFTEHTAFLNTKMGDIGGSGLLYLWTILYSIRADEHKDDEKKFEDFVRRNLKNANSSFKKCEEQGIDLPKIDLSMEDEFTLLRGCPKSMVKELRSTLNKLQK